MRIRSRADVRTSPTLFYFSKVTTFRWICKKPEGMLFIRGCHLFFSLSFRQIVRPKHIPNDGQVRSDRRKISRLDKNQIVKNEKSKKSESLTWIVRQLTIRLVKQSSSREIANGNPEASKTSRFKIKSFWENPSFRINQAESFLKIQINSVEKSSRQKSKNQKIRIEKTVANRINPKIVKNQIKERNPKNHPSS